MSTINYPCPFLLGIARPSNATSVGSHFTQMTSATTIRKKSIYSLKEDERDDIYALLHGLSKEKSEFMKLS
jgi:hypothetical protein